MNSITDRLSAIQPLRGLLDSAPPSTTAPSSFSSSSSSSSASSKGASLRERLQLIESDEVIVTQVALEASMSARRTRVSLAQLVSSWLRLFAATVASEVRFQRVFFHDAEWDDFDMMFSPVTAHFNVRLLMLCSPPPMLIPLFAGGAVALSAGEL